VLDERIAPEVPELPWHLGLGLVLVDEKPAQYALYRRGDAQARGHVVAWLFVLPDGSAVLLPTEPAGARPILTTMASVRRRWVHVMEAELVQVVGRQPLNMAA
jgi:hypothetical protein